MDAMWVVTSTALIAFCSFGAYILGHRRGYRAGGLKVIGEWRKHIEESVEDDK